jgi:hypothetical protein
VGKRRARGGGGQRQGQPTTGVIATAELQVRLFLLRRQRPAAKQRHADDFAIHRRGQHTAGATSE